MVLGFDGGGPGGGGGLGVKNVSVWGLWSSIFPVLLRVLLAEPVMLVVCCCDEEMGGSLSLRPLRLESVSSSTIVRL